MNKRYLLNKICVVYALYVTLTFSPPSYSDMWVCSGIPVIHRYVIRDLYTGGSYMINGNWVKMYMLPIDDPLTIRMFKQELIPINLVKRLSSNNSIIDRGYRVVPDVEVMAHAMLSDQPAIGFSYGEGDNTNVKSCNIID